MRELPCTLTLNTDFFPDLEGHHQALEWKVLEERNIEIIKGK